MAAYISNTASRDQITLMLTRAEAKALRDVANAGEEYGNRQRINPAKNSAYERAISALTAATNPSARRAGFFET